MTNSINNTINGIEIDEKKVKSLLSWLILVEKKNVKSKEKSDQQMVTMIQKKIEEIVQCY